MTIAFFVLLWLFINLMILFIMNSVEEQTSPLDFFVEMIAVIVSPILWISFWTVVNRIRKRQVFLQRGNLQEQYVATHCNFKIYYGRVLANVGKKVAK